MLVEIYMYSQEKIKYNKNLFRDFYTGFYDIVDANSIKDIGTDYDLLDKNQNVINRFNKKQFYLEVH